MSRSRDIGDERASKRREDSVEEHRLKTRVVVEVLDVTEIWNRGGDGGVQCRSTVRGDLQPVGTGDSGRPQPHRVSTTSGDVDLQTVDSPRLDHSREIRLVVAVLASRYIRRDPVANLTQAGEIV